MERTFDHARHRLKRGGLRNPLMVSPYLTYGTHRRLFIHGRVLEDKNVRAARASDTMWSNLRNAWKRFDSNEVPHAEVRVSIEGREAVLTTDAEGFFETWIELDTPLEPSGYLRDVDFELLSPHAAKQVKTHFAGQVVVPPDQAAYGVISDIDDTVLITEATSTLSLLRKVLFGNARTRLPFAGVAGFYQALHLGADHRAANPVFYVSSSPWNLYDLLVDFLRLNDIPAGPLMLRDWGITPTEFLPTKHGEHKHQAIEAILSTFPELPFLLIGDSGQEDPEIYHEVVANHPGQVIGIYIRAVTGQADRRRTIEELAGEVDRQGVPLVLVQDTLQAAVHAADHGWIDPADVELVRVSMEGR